MSVGAGSPRSAAKPRAISRIAFVRDRPWPSAYWYPASGHPHLLLYASTAISLDQIIAHRVRRLSPSRLSERPGIAGHCGALRSVRFGTLRGHRASPRWRALRRPGGHSFCVVLMPHPPRSSRSPGLTECLHAPVRCDVDAATTGRWRGKVRALPDRCAVAHAACVEVELIEHTIADRPDGGTGDDRG